MTDENQNKAQIRQRLREALASQSESDRHLRSIRACALLSSSPEFQAASTIMLYLNTAQEVETAPLAQRAWRDGKTVVVPKVSWDQKRMLPVEISSLHSDITTGQMGIREPVGGKPVPANLIDLVVVPGLGFTRTGFRIGRGMGFYDRFLAQAGFLGLSCGLAFDLQVVDALPVLDHDMPLSMLVTDTGIRRFASNCIEHK